MATYSSTNYDYFEEAENRRLQKHYISEYNRWKEHYKKMFVNETKEENNNLPDELFEI